MDIIESIAPHEKCELKYIGSLNHIYEIVINYNFNYKFKNIFFIK
jgi:hypothetical protein